MNYNQQILRALLFIFLFLFFCIIDGNLYAQIDLPEDGELEDTPAASINSFIGIAMAIGTYLGYKKLKKN